MSDGGTGSKKTKKRGAYFTFAAEAKKLMAELGLDDIDELRMALTDRPSAAETSASMAQTRGADVSVVMDAPALTAVNDPLAWITDDTPTVALVMRPKSVCIRPAKTMWMPPMESVRIKAHRNGPWLTMPFRLHHEDRDMDRNLKLRYSRWNHFRISQDFAHDVYSDERHPIPEKTVVSVANFKGWDRYGNRPAGAAEPTGGVALREVVRRLLQRKANACFLNTMHHGAGEFDPRVVNPYGNKLEGFQVRVERKRSDDPVPTFIDQD